MDTLPLLRANRSIVNDAQSFLSGMIVHLLTPPEYEARIKCIGTLGQIKKSMNKNIEQIERRRKINKKEGVK